MGSRLLLFAAASLGAAAVASDAGSAAAAPDAGSTATAPNAGAPLVRDERRIDGEVWRLEWLKAPEPACADEPDGIVTCPCTGFAPGLAGDLQLVLERPGRPARRLALAPLFGPAPADGAVVPRDGQLLRLGDYDHDGRASEFVLQIGAAECGHTPSVLVGVSRARDALHAFGTAEHPDRPLVLDHPQAWEELKAKGVAVSREQPCGDHGSDVEIVVTVRADAKGLHALEETFACDEQLNATGKKLGETQR